MCTCARRQGEGRGRVERLKGDVHLRKAARGGQRRVEGLEGDVHLRKAARGGQRKGGGVGG